MRYSKIDSFEKHLDDALPDHPAEIYFILMEDPFEREFVARCIAKKMGNEIKRCDPKDFLVELQTPLLFVDKRILLCDEVRDKEIPIIKDRIVILTGKTPPPFHKKMEKIGVTLDLTIEKPWDKKKRVQRWLLDYARGCGKVLSGEGATYLADFSHVNFAILLRELDKVMTYSGDEKHLSLKKIREVASLDPFQSGWELSEAVVFGGEVDHSGEIDLYPLVGQLRYQLEMGLQIALGKNPSKIPPKKLEHIQRKGLNSSYFIKGLQELFHLEVNIRLNLPDKRLLFDQFRSKLAAGR